MFENARREVGRFDEAADLRSHSAVVRSARHQFGPANHVSRITCSAKKPPFLIDTEAIRNSSNLLKTQAGTHV